MPNSATSQDVQQLLGSMFHCKILDEWIVLRKRQVMCESYFSDYIWNESDNFPVFLFP